MFVAAMTMMGMTTACSSDSLDDEATSYSSNGDSSTSSSGEVTTTTLSTMKNFTIAIDKTTAEPTAVADATYFDEADDIKTQQFTTQVAIDMSNPTEKTENGVTITVTDGKYVTADHGKTTGICYVVSGTTADGSLNIFREPAFLSYFCGGKNKHYKNITKDEE